MESLVHAMLSNAVAAAFLAVLVAIAGRACRRPAVIHSLWLVVMLKLVTPPILPVSLPEQWNPTSQVWTKGEDAIDQANFLAAAEPGRDVELVDTVESSGATFSPDDASQSQDTTAAGFEHSQAGSSRAWNIGLPAGWSWEYLVAALVLSGALAWWLLALVRIVRFHRLIKEIGPAADEWQGRTAELAGRLGLSEAPCLCLVPGRVPPMLWAIGGKPRLLVPAELFSATSPDQRTSLLVHELAHLKRRDHWVRWLELFVGGLYWWHPAVWWGRRLLREAEEQCCDAWVVWAMPQGAKTYASALLAAMEFVSGARTAPGASSATSGNGHVSFLKRRLKMIVRAQTPKGLSWTGRLAVLGTAALLLPLGASWGRNSDSDRPPGELEQVVDFYDYNLGPVQDRARDERGQAPPSDNGEHGRSANSTLRQSLSDQLEKYKVAIAEKRAKLKDLIAKGDADDFDVAFLQRQLDDLMRRDDGVKAHLEQLAFDDDQTNDTEQGDGRDRNRETAERFEERVKGLVEKLTKEVGPVGEELRKILERSIDEFHETLKKDDVTADDLRKALEKTHDDLRKAFEKGGTVNKELRESVEKSRRDLREEWDRTREEYRSAMRDRAGARRAQEREREAEKGAGRERETTAKESDERAQDRAELEKARGEIRALEQQLRQAQRRFTELQRRTAQRGGGPGGRRSEVPAARKASPGAPEEKSAPRADTPRSSRAPSQPGGGRGGRGGAPPPAAGPGGMSPGGPPSEGMRFRAPGMRPADERRLRELENKLNRVLKELEELKADKKPGETKGTSPIPRRPRQSSAIL